MRASCSCTSTVMLRAGAVVCASCSAPIVGDAAPTDVSSVRLPADAKTPEPFNRACRSGRVAGARKVGRIWICSLEAWNRRAPATAPIGVPKRPAKKTPKCVLRLRDEASDLLRELGLGDERRTG